MGKVNNTVGRASPSIVTPGKANSTKTSGPSGGPSGIRKPKKQRASVTTPKAKVLGRFERKDFTSGKAFAIRGANLTLGTKIPDKANLNTIDAARPHRTSFDYLRSRLENLWKGTETLDDFSRWTGRLLQAQSERKDILLATCVSLSGRPLDDVEKGQLHAAKSILTHVASHSLVLKLSQSELVMAFDLIRNNANSAKYGNPSVGVRTKLGGEDLLHDCMQRFLDQINSVYANVPDLGPHSTVNAVVQEHFHVHANADGSLTPASNAALNMTPNGHHRVAVTVDGLNIVGTDGTLSPILNLDHDVQTLIMKHGTHATNIRDQHFVSDMRAQFPPK